MQYKLLVSTRLIKTEIGMDGPFDMSSGLFTSRDAARVEMIEQVMSIMAKENDANPMTRTAVNAIGIHIMDYFHYFNPMNSTSGHQFIHWKDVIRDEGVGTSLDNYLTYFEVITPEDESQLLLDNLFTRLSEEGGDSFKNIQW